MKKILYVLLSVCLLSGLVSCGDGNEDAGLERELTLIQSKIDKLATQMKDANMACERLDTEGKVEACKKENVYPLQDRLDSYKAERDEIMKQLGMK